MKVIGVPSLEQLRFFDNIEFVVIKYIRGFKKISLSKVGISLKQSITEDANVRLTMPQAKNSRVRSYPIPCTQIMEYISNRHVIV